MRKSPKGNTVVRIAWWAARCALIASPLVAQSTPGQTPNDSAAFFRALDLEGAGKYREAAPLFRQALHSSSAVGALLGLERAYAELHLTDSLLAPLDTLIRQSPAEPIYRSVQLRSLQSLGREAEMNAAFERWVHDAP